MTGWDRASLTLHTPLLRPTLLLGLHLSSFAVTPPYPACKGYVLARYQKTGGTYVSIYEGRKIEAACGNFGDIGAPAHLRVRGNPAVLFSWCGDTACYSLLRWREAGIEIDIEESHLTGNQLLSFAHAMRIVRTCRCQ